MRTAILIPAHNEEIGIASAIKSAAGYDTYVVSDNSTDQTTKIARSLTPNVLAVKRGGKGRALHALIDHYDITGRYDSFIILDGDSTLAPGAVEAFQEAMKPGIGGAVGQMHNHQHGVIAMWRKFQYAMIYRLYRRGMATMNCIHIMCGTCAIWSTALFKELTWDDTPVEDMDHTYQMHRKKIGRVAYAPKAHVYTQEPATFRDYFKQQLRWFRGYWFTTAKFNTPFGFQSLDLGQAIFLTEAALIWGRLVSLPFAFFIHTGFAHLLIWSFVYDFALMFIYTLMGSVITKDWRMVAYYPVFVALQTFDMLTNFYSFMTWRKARSGSWVSPKRVAQP